MIPTTTQTATLIRATARMIAMAERGSCLIQGMREWYFVAVERRSLRRPPEAKGGGIVGGGEGWKEGKNVN